MLSREEIRRRQLKGIAAAKKNGKYHGKPTTLTPHNKKIKAAFRAYFKRDFDCYKSMADIARMAGVSRQTLYRKLKQYKPQAKDYLNRKEYRQWMIIKHPDSKVAQHQLTLEWQTMRYHDYGVEPPWKSQNRRP